MWFEVPEEMRKKMEEHANKMELAAESYRHDSIRLFQELDLEQLRIFRHILHNLVMDTDGNLAAYYEGTAATVLQLKFNVCPACGVNHDEEAADFGKQPESEPEPAPEQEMLPSFELSEQDKANMEKYHLDDMRDEDSLQILGFICTGVSGQGSCGMVYPSIEDRMLREPDTCSGCQQKAAWG